MPVQVECRDGWLVIAWNRAGVAPKTAAAKAAVKKAVVKKAVVAKVAAAK